MRTLNIVLVLMLLVSCYRGKPDSANAPQDSCEVCGDPVFMPDSAAEDSTLPSVYYSIGFNFIVVADSLCLQAEEPLLTTQGTPIMCLHRDEALVVAARQIIAADSIDSVWVRVARDQFTVGWVHESELLAAVVPDDPISLFIHTFSNQHLIYFLSTVALVMFVLLVRHRMKRHSRMVHFQDIPSPYPTLLCIALSASAVFYACIQHFAPAVWQHFYFAPTLNPFSLHPLPCAFISSVWVVVILSIATLDDVWHLLSPSEAVIYLLSTLGWCMGLYTIFSLTPLVWVALPGFVLYTLWAVRRYLRYSRPTCLCGGCGKPIHTPPATCPWCGTVNAQPTDKAVTR